MLQPRPWWTDKDRRNTNMTSSCLSTQEPKRGILSNVFFSEKEKKKTSSLQFKRCAWSMACYRHSLHVAQAAEDQSHASHRHKQGRRRGETCLSQQLTITYTKRLSCWITDRKRTTYRITCFILTLKPMIWSEQAIHWQILWKATYNLGMQQTSSFRHKWTDLTDTNSSSCDSGNCRVHRGNNALWLHVTLQLTSFFLSRKQLPFTVAHSCRRDKQQREAISSSITTSRQKTQKTRRQI